MEITQKEHLIEFDTPFVIKILSKLGIEGSISNLVKGIYKEHTAGM